MKSVKRIMHNYQKRKKEIESMNTVLSEYNAKKQNIIDRKIRTYSIAKTLLFIGIILFIFEIIYFWYILPKTELVTIYNYLIYLPIGIIFLSSIIFLHGANIGNKQRYSNDSGVYFDHNCNEKDDCFWD